MDTMNKKIERIQLEDGRMAERHSSLDEEGNEVVEIYSEPVKNLSLEKRVVNKHRKVLAEQVVETIQDGAVIEQKTTSIDPPSPQLVNHIRVAQESTAPLSAQQIADAVASAVSTAMEAKQVAALSVPPRVKNPPFSAQALTEERAQETGKKDNTFITVLGVMVVGQLVLFGYIMYVNFFAGGF